MHPGLNVYSKVHSFCCALLLESRLLENARFFREASWHGFMSISVFNRALNMITRERALNFLIHNPHIKFDDVNYIGYKGYFCNWKNAFFSYAVAELHLPRSTDHLAFGSPVHQVFLSRALPLS